ncbi:caspase family protein [Amycolatopsis magusensis]|uniref:Peptidase C14 caspase domain-containing protein n=1 Tax=Amycolatopsis magusensis TaxID=882444 RepID=A0ABS4PHK8_9PSEU|nr:caspase family protein [Amycolatopsis magusensis]MBP2178904.1 hypothetical protein [Amycolatopsis magusensis]
MAEEHRALLVGVHAYIDGSGFSRLKGPPNDLRALYDVLRDPQVGLFTVKEPLANPTTGQLRVGVQKFLGGADRNDHLLLYYSGHGETSARTKHLCLTSAEAEKVALDGSSLAFDELYEWVKESPARSVTVVLDCCRSGMAFKGSAPDFSEFDALFADEAPRQKAVKVLTAGIGFENALDAERDKELSPFTARLIEALKETAEPNDRGLVSFGSVVAAMRASTGPDDPLLQDWGTGGPEGPHLAQRSSYVKIALERAGLQEATLQRSAGAVRNGKIVHVPVKQVDDLVERLSAGHPATMFVSGPVGSGKTWILCDIVDRLAAQGWLVQEFVPSREPEDAQKLLAALKKRCAQLRASTEGPCLLVIDGIEWSNVWAEFVTGLQEVTERDGFGASVLASLEIQRGQIQPDHEYKSWRTGGDRDVQSVTGRSVDEFVAEVLSPAHNPSVVDWPSDQLNRARLALRAQVGTDLWAIIHLGSRWHDPDAEEAVIRAVWEERIGEITPEQTEALHTVAALSRFNLWFPLVDALRAGETTLLGLGPEFSRKNDAVRLNSGFLCRAILARQVRGGEVVFSFQPGAADPAARRVITGYLRSLLSLPHRQQDVITTLSRLRYDRRVLTHVVRELSVATRRRPSAWDLWSDDWEDLAAVAEILSFVRTALPPDQSGELGGRLCRFVVTNPLAGVRLPTAVLTLELLRALYSGRSKSASLDEAQDRLITVAEGQLVDHRWPASLRRRLLWVLRKLKRLDEPTVARLGPLLLRPVSPPELTDLVLAFEFTRIASPGLPVDALRATLAKWEVVAEDLVRAPEVGDRLRGPEQLAVRCVLARHIFDDALAAALERQLKDELRTTSAVQLNQMLGTCTRMDRRFTSEIIGTVDIDRWSTTVYRNASALTVAQLVNTLSKVRPDLAVRTLSLPDGTADTTLANQLAAAIAPNGDAVSASILLKAAAKCEEQRGVLDGGFTQHFARALGEQFLVDTLADNNRLAIVGHLIEGFAWSRTGALESVRQKVLGIIEDQIEHSGSENGARLALILSEPDILDKSFITELRSRAVVLRSTVLSRMLNTHNPGALTAYHELGVQLFPGIENSFAAEVEKSGTSWRETRMFDNLAGEGNVVLALRAARAVAATLVLSGRHEAGSAILDAYQHAYQTDRPGRIWSARVFDADDVDLAEALRHLRVLRAGEARRIVEANEFRLSQTAHRLSARELADLVNATAEISVEAGERLVRAADAVLLKDALDELDVGGDLFSQAAALSSLAAAEDRLFVRVVPQDAADRFRRSWTGQVQVINNPALVQSLIRVAGNSGREAALTVARTANLRSLKRRLDRLNVADAAGFAQLVCVLAEVTPHVLPDLVGETHAHWLLLKSPIDVLARLAESLVASGATAAAGVVNALSLRLNMTPNEIPIRHQGRYWLAAGWVAWTAVAKLGCRLRLDYELDASTLGALVPYVRLWALAWFEQDEWTKTAIARALDLLEALASPPGSPAAAAAILTACEALGVEPPLCGATNLENWYHALDAENHWVRALLNASQPGTRLHQAFTADWSPWSTHRLHARLTWHSHGWRAVPSESLTLLVDLTRDSNRQATSKKPKWTSAWQRAD